MGSAFHAGTSTIQLSWVPNTILPKRERGGGGKSGGVPGEKYPCEPRPILNKGDEGVDKKRTRKVKLRKWKWGCHRRDVTEARGSLRPGRTGGKEKGTKGERQARRGGGGGGPLAIQKKEKVKGVCSSQVVLPEYNKKCCARGGAVFLVCAWKGWCHCSGRTGEIFISMI